MSTTFRPRVWTSMGAALVLGAGALAGCSGEAGDKAETAPANPAAASAGGEGEGEGAA
ncbi:carbohydrate ABC transporter substrate-binding protein, partial [Caulobacter sp. 17J65-9]|nr:carbohydrate ABC transporter substrate-binding protein [Caulobacter sp. 17J65-9]